MKISTFVQARMGSTRLPGKVLFPLLGKPMICHVVDRLKESKRANHLAVLIPTGRPDDPLYECLQSEEKGVDVFRGSENDVLSRFDEAACHFHSDIIVRITADCPCIDPKLVDAVIDLFLQTPECAYASNTMKRSFPRGFDVEVFSIHALKRAFLEAKDEAEREHVTLYLYRHSDEFPMVALVSPVDLSSCRLCVDEREDLAAIEHVYKALGKSPLTFETIQELFRKNPELFKKNAHIRQKSVFLSPKALQNLDKVPQIVYYS